MLELGVISNLRVIRALQPARKCHIPYFCFLMFEWKVKDHKEEN